MTNLNSEYSNNEQNKVAESSLSMKNGGNFYFDVRGQQVRVWFSCFSGGEKIYVNDELVSSKHSWRKMSTHHFKLQDENYTVKVGVRSWAEAFKGIYMAELYREKQLIDQDEVNLLGTSKEKKPFTWQGLIKELLPFAIVGGVVGFLVGYFSG